MTRSESGQILALFAGSLAALLMLAAFTIDAGYAWWAKRALQSGADAAALAGAQALPDGAVATNVAMEYSGDKDIGTARNKSVPGTDATVTVTCVSLCAGGQYDRITVEQTANVKTFFWRVLGRDNYDVSARAVAGRTVSSGPSLAIFAEQNCSAGIGLKANGENFNIQGGVHANGNFEVNGNSFRSGRATYWRTVGGTQSGCPSPPPISPTARFDGNPPPPVDVARRDWLTPHTVASLTPQCTTTVNGDLKFETFGATIPSAVYCVNGTFTVNANAVKSAAGGITVLARKIEINGNDLVFEPRIHNVLFFQTQSGEMSLNTANYTWTGYVINKFGNVKVNGSPALSFQGLIEAKSVEINLNNFSMIGTYQDSSGPVSISLVE